MSSKSSANVFGDFLNTVKQSNLDKSKTLEEFVSGFGGTSYASPSLGGSGVAPGQVAPGQAAPGQGAAVGGRPAVPEPGADSLTTVMQAIATRNQPTTIVELSRLVQLPLDTLAATLRDGVGTGLLKPEERASDGALAYRITPLGQQMF